MLNLYYDLLLLYGNIVSNKSKRKSEGQKKQSIKTRFTLEEMFLDSLMFPNLSILE